MAASFQKAVTEVLTEHAVAAAKEYHMDKIAIAGGVASNSALRASMKAACEKAGPYIVSSIADTVHGQCGHDRCGGILRIHKWNKTWMGSECHTKPQAG